MSYIDDIDGALVVSPHYWPLTIEVIGGGGGGGPVAFSVISGSPYDNTALGNALLEKADLSGLSGVAFTGDYESLINLPGGVSQAEAEAGTSTEFKLWSPQRVNQAIQALAPSAGTNTLQSVTNNGNVTPSAIQITGQDNFNIATDGLAILHTPGAGSQIASISGSIPVGYLVFGSGSLAIQYLYNSGANESSLNFSEETPSASGAAFTTRVSGLTALNDNDFIILGQFESLGSESFIPISKDVISQGPVYSNAIDNLQGSGIFFQDISTPDRPNTGSAGGMLVAKSQGDGTVIPMLFMGAALDVTDDFWWRSRVGEPWYQGASRQWMNANFYTRTNLQTSGQAQVHWDNITNEPSFVPQTRAIELIAGNGISIDNASQDLSADRNWSISVNQAFLNTLYITTDQLGQPDGVATLGSDGRLLPEQSPTSVIRILGEWDASTNTPTLSDATGVQGDAYSVSVSGTQDLGSGPISFTAGQLIVHNGSVWFSMSGFNVQTLAFSNGQLSISDGNTVNLDSRYYTRSQSDSTFVPVTRTLAAGTGLTGGGDLTGNRSFSINPAYTGFDARYYTETELQTAGQAQVHWDNLTNVPPVTPQNLTMTGDGQLTISAGNSVLVDSVRATTVGGDVPLPGAQQSCGRIMSWGSAQSNWPFNLGSGLQIERRSNDTNRSGFRLLIEHNSQDTDLVYQKKLSGDLTTWGPVHTIMNTDGTQIVAGQKTFSNIRYDSENMGGSTVINFNTANLKNKTIAVDTSFTFSNVANNAWCNVRITNTDTDMHLVTFTGASMANGATGIISAGSYAIFSFMVMDNVIHCVQSTFS